MKQKPYIFPFIPPLPCDFHSRPPQRMYQRPNSEKLLFGTLMNRSILLLFWKSNYFEICGIKHPSKAQLVELLQEGGPLPGPTTGLLSNTRKWIVRGDTCADKARDFIGKGHRSGEQQGKGTQEISSVTWLVVSGFMVMGLVSRLSLANHSNPRVLPGGACLVQPRWVLARGILGSGRTHGVSFRPFRNPSCWWWLISSVFLTRISCQKTAHANGY